MANGQFQTALPPRLPGVPQQIPSPAGTTPFMLPLGGGAGTQRPSAFPLPVTGFTGGQPAFGRPPVRPGVPFQLPQPGVSVPERRFPDITTLLQRGLQTPDTATQEVRRARGVRRVARARVGATRAARGAARRRAVATGTAEDAALLREQRQAVRGARQERRVARRTVRRAKTARRQERRATRGVRKVVRRVSRRLARR
jgi:hypothetical protein